MKTHITCLWVVPAIFLAACKENASNPSAAPAAETSAALSAVLENPPTGEAKPIHIVRTSAKPGDEVTLSGRIMGNAQPFVEGRAAFILGDPEVLTACSDTPGDNCETPWDACCDSPEDKKKGIATIQVIGADGRVLKESIEGAGGVEKLATVTVTGKVAEGSSPDLLIVNAAAIRVGK